MLYDRIHRELTNEEMMRIANTYHNWRQKDNRNYEDVIGFCKTATIQEIASHNFALVPGRYTGCEPYKAVELPSDTLSKCADITKSRFLQLKMAENTVSEMLGVLTK